MERIKQAIDEARAQRERSLLAATAGGGQPAPAWSDDAAVIRTLSPIDELPEGYQRSIAASGDVIVIAPHEAFVVPAGPDEFAHFLLAGDIGIEANGQPRLRLSRHDAAAAYAIDPSVRPWRLTTIGAEPARVFRIRQRELARQIALAGQGRPSTELDVTEFDGQQVADDWVSRVLRNGVLAALPPEMILQVLLRATEETVQAGDTLIEQGAPGDFYFLIKAGRARVARRIGRAGLIHLAEIGPGDGVGEEALVVNGLRNASVTMLTDGIVLKLGSADFHELIRDPLLSAVTQDRATELVEHGARWLDARYEREFALGHLDGAINLPLPLLRLQYARLDPDTPYIVYSDDPACSAVAAFLLRARGVDARYVNNVVDAPRFAEPPVSSTSSVTPPAHPLQESTMHNDAPSVFSDPEDATAIAPEAPEHYADTYTGQSLARLVEEIHTSGIAATDDNAMDNEVMAEEAPRIALDDTLFRLHNDDADDPIAEPASLPIAAPTTDDPAGTVDALTQALSDFEHRMRAQLETVRLEERARHERRFAERVGLMQKRAEELLREKLLQARARDRERLAERERHLDEMHARLSGLANKVTHQKARIQEARRQIADKLAAVESLHRDLNNLGRSMTQQIDDLEGLIPYDASRTPE